jgi:hypothetical protein
MSNPPSLRARWLPAVKRTRLVGPSCRRMLTEIGEHHMTEAGRVAVTQERLAATLGLSVVRVKHLFREARTAQFLDLVQTGYRGYPTIHHAMIPAAARTEDRLDRRSTPNPQSRTRRGVDTRPPISGKGVDVTDPLSPPKSARKGVDTRPPTARVKERQTPTTPAPLRESRAEQSGGAPPPAPPGSASGGRADEEQDASFLIIAPRAEREAQGSGGREAPGYPSRTRAPRSGPRRRSRPGGGVGGGGARPRPVHPKSRELGTCTWHPDQRIGSCRVCMKASADLRKRRPDVFCTKFHPAIRLDDNGHCLGLCLRGPLHAARRGGDRVTRRRRLDPDEPSPAPQPLPDVTEEERPVPEKADNPVARPWPGC